MFASFYQRAPLHLAAKEGYSHTVECLVKKGANINIKDKKGVSVTGLLKVDLIVVGFCRSNSLTF